MNAPQTNTDKLRLRLKRYVSHDRLVLLRNLGYGGAAVCLAFLVSLTQVGAKTSLLKTGIVCASIALPAWLLLGTIFEYYIFLGKESYAHLRTRFLGTLIAVCMSIGGGGTYGVALATIWFLFPEAAYTFMAFSLAAAVSAVVFQWHLAEWWYGDHGPAHRAGEDV